MADIGKINLSPQEQQCYTRIKSELEQLQDRLKTTPEGSDDAKNIQSQIDDLKNDPKTMNYMCPDTTYSNIFEKGQQSEGIMPSNSELKKSSIFKKHS